MKESDFPPLFVAADAASLWGQRWHRRIVAVNLALIVFGSVLAFVATLGGGTLRVVSAAISAAVMIVGVSTDRLHRRLGDDKSWFEGRAVAETVKSLAWRYMMRTPPFDGEAEADPAFAGALAEVEKEVPGTVAAGGGVSPRSQITDRMREVRALDLPGRRAVYADERLADQMR